MSTTVASKWERVTRHNPCPVCSKHDWCLLSQDGKAAICTRTESDRPVGNKGAGWLHILDASIPMPQPKRRAETNPTRKAAPAMLDMGYRALLSELSLSPAHRHNLQRRGLTDGEIDCLGYKTLPVNKRPELVARLQSKGIQLSGVPGFHCGGGYWQLTGAAGIALPVKDARHSIEGIQIRCDTAANGRYKWLSSKDFPQGCSPGAPVHVAGEVAIGSEMWITEGPMKADIAALKLRRLVLAVAGVNNWPGVIPIIRELKPTRVVIAFDMDKLNNSAVKLHLDTLTACLIRRGIRVFEADWDAGYKGIDDLLTGGQP